MVTAGKKNLEVQKVYDEERHIYTIVIPEQDVSEEICVTFTQGVSVAENDKMSEVYKALYRAEIEYDTKERIYAYMKEGKTPIEMIGILQGMHLPGAVYGMLSEVLLA